jgi:asparagine synthase (glutamine-hydrolysing)
MCGIALRFFKEPTDTKVDVIRNMTDAMAHRGHDQKDIYAGLKYHIGFRRLAITDLQNGNQPKKAGEWTVYLNGEIYNYKELAKELKLQSNSDTEVIAEGFRQQGFEFVKKLNGMFFILALYGNHVYVFRDRYGIKPVYYFENNKEIVIASEIKALLKHPAYSIQENEWAVRQFMCFNNIFTDETFFKGINKLEKGTCWHLNTATKTKYWSWKFTQTETKYEPEKVQHLLTQAVERQTPEEVECGAWLSGGLDSNIIVNLSGDIHTFTAGFKDGNDERSVAEIQGRKQYEIVFNTHRNLHPTIHALEDLRMGASWSNYTLYELTSKFVKVCLQGTGGDELFSGYNWRYAEPDYWNVVNRTKVTDNYCRELFAYVFPEDTLEARWKFDADYFLEGVLLVSDKLSMAHTIEDRVPFLDNDLVDYASKLPAEFKANKKILRQAFNNMLPGRVLRGKKWGFTSPDYFTGEGNAANKWAHTAYNSWKKQFLNQ